MTLTDYFASILVILFYFLSHVEGKAKPGFLGTYMEDNTEESTSLDNDYEEAPFDSDVNIPGRHFPRRPYTLHLNKDGSPQVYSPKFQGHALPSQYWELGDSLQEDPTDPPIGPYFDRSLLRNITVPVGKTARLMCRVLNQGNKTVSWIRHKDLHILTVGRYRYSMDIRIAVSANPTVGEWILIIEDVTPNDAGRYECQISTETILSFIVNLDVLDYSQERHFVGETSKDEPRNSLLLLADKSHLNYTEAHKGKQIVVKRRARAEILNGAMVYAHPGSRINLTCVVNHGASETVFILWKFQNKILDIKDDKNVQTSTLSSGITISSLFIRNLSETNSGRYTCAPNNGDETSTELHVRADDVRATTQSGSICNSVAVALFFFSYVVCFLQYNQPANTFYFCFLFICL